MSIALTRLHGITPEFHGHSWKTLSRNTEEALHQWHVRIQFAMQAWMKDCEGKKEVLDRLVMERFITSLEPRTEQWTRNQRPKTSEDAVLIADSFQRNTPLAFNPPVWRPPRPQPARPNPWTSTRPQPEQGPPLLRTPGDRSPAPRSGNRLPEWDEQMRPRCFNCNVYGHMARECPSPLWVKHEKPTVKTEVALMAVSSDHSSPPRSDTRSTGLIGGYINNIPTERMKVDTGACLSFVDRSFLPDHENLPG